MSGGGPDLRAAEAIDLKPVVAKATLAPHPRASIASEAAPGLDFPLMVEIVADGAPQRFWLDAELDARLSEDHPAPTNGERITEIALSQRALKSLGLDGESDADPVSLRIPASAKVGVLASNVDDIPQDATVDASPELLNALGISRWSLRPRLLVTSAGSNGASGIAFPVRVRRRDISARSVRMSMLLRTLCDAGRGARLQVSRLPKRSAIEKKRAARARVRRHSHPYHFGWATIAAGRLLWIPRAVDSALELFLRVLFRAPRITVATTQTLPGDDAGGLVRLHGAVFPMLGIRPGDQVVIVWGDSRSAVVAFEDYVEPDATPLQVVQRARRVETMTPQLAPGTPAHLVARLSAETRRDLGIPATTVVEVRRRIRPLLFRHLNQLSIPVAGLVVAGLAVQQLQGWPIVAGLIVAVILGLANLRISKAPRGLWP